MIVLVVIIGIFSVIISIGNAVAKNINQFVACILGNARGYGVCGVLISFYISGNNKVWIIILVVSIVLLIVSSIAIGYIDEYNNKNDHKVNKINSFALFFLFLAIAYAFMPVCEYKEADYNAGIVEVMFSLISISMAFCSLAGDSDKINDTNITGKKFLAGNDNYRNTDCCICGHDYHYGGQCTCGHKD